MSPHYVPEHQDLVALQDQLNRLRWKISKSPDKGRYALYDNFGQYRGDYDVQGAWEYIERLGFDIAR